MAKPENEEVPGIDAQLTDSRLVEELIAAIQRARVRMDAQAIPAPVKDDKEP